MPLSVSVHDGHASVSAGFARLADRSPARIRPPTYAGLLRCRARKATSRYVSVLWPLTALQVAFAALLAQDEPPPSFPVPLAPSCRS